MKVNQSSDDLNNHLFEQIQFLRASSNSYDSGFTGEAKRLATVIRTLVHETRESQSLLGQLEIRNKIHYYNTAIPQSQFGLTGIKTSTNGISSYTEYVAPLDNGGPLRKERPWILLPEWWDAMKVLYDGQAYFTRKKLVLSLVNKDGGAHVDPQLDEAYANLSRNNTLNVFHDGAPVKGVELASVRQIAFELCRSLQEVYPSYFE